MLYREIMAVCSEIHTKHINTAVWAERSISHVAPNGAYTDCNILNGVNDPSLPIAV